MQPVVSRQPIVYILGHSTILYFALLKTNTHTHTLSLGNIPYRTKVIGHNRRFLIILNKIDYINILL